MRSIHLRHLAPLVLLTAGLALTSCQKAATTAEPQLLAELTDQQTIYACSKCGMEFDRAGRCSMCDVELTETHVAYVCPTDGKNVGKAGTCAEHGAEVTIVRTPAGAAAPDTGAS